MMTGVFKLL